MHLRRSSALATCLAVVVCGVACSRDNGVRSSVQTASRQLQGEPAIGTAAPTASTAAPSSSKPEERAGVQGQIEQLAKYALDELTALGTRQSLGEWKKHHASGTLELYGPRLSEQSNQGWCARVRLETSLDADRSVRRDAYFYPPDPPTVLSLPVGARPDELLDQCRLGLVWADVEDVDAARAERLANATRESLVSVLGTGQLNAKLSWWGAGYWRKTALWNERGLSLATATTNFRAWPTGGSGATTRVLVAAAGGASRIRLEPFQRRTDPPEEYVEAFGVIASRINEAISIAGVGGTAEADARSALKLLSAASPPWHDPSDSDREFILDAINEWFVSAPSSPPTRRAAALFVADQLLGASGAGWGRNENPPIRQQLEAHGATFNWATLGDTWFYAHSWLKQSRQIDPDSRVGDLAFITLMESGFETSGTCSDQGGNGFRAVIREGGEFLRRKPDSVLSSDIHLLMAGAFGDIVRLANGGGYEESVSADYKSEAASSRTRAIEEYRLAFAPPMPASARAQEGWRNAWRLMAGLSPSRTYFYCVYD
jgi:hypothetical protein